jgi:hypothetical protein
MLPLLGERVGGPVVEMVRIAFRYHPDRPLPHE